MAFRQVDHSFIVLVVQPSHKIAFERRFGAVRTGGKKSHDRNRAAF